MADPTPCDAGYPAFLAKEYLRTLTGKTTDDPVGLWCEPGDVDAWAASVTRIRQALSDVLSRTDNRDLDYPKGLGKRIANWVFDSLKIQPGSLKHLSGRTCNRDVAKAVDFGQRGVTLLAEVHCEVTKLGGTVPGVPSTTPPPKELPYGTGFWTLALLVVGLVNIAYMKPKGSC